jgi:alkaline phosphatase D
MVSGRGPELWELTTSPLANDPWREPANGEDPTIVAEVADRVNYGLVDVDLDREGAEIVLALHAEDGGALIEQRVPLASLEAR